MNQQTDHSDKPEYELDPSSQAEGQSDNQSIQGVPKNNEQPPQAEGHKLSPKLRFLIMWVIAHILIHIPIIIFWTQSINNNFKIPYPDFPMVFVTFLALSLFIGICQWIPLRIAYQHDFWWIPATVFGVLTGVIVASSVRYIFIAPDYVDVLPISEWQQDVFFAWLVVSVFQWLVLTRWVHKAWLWIPVKLLTLGLGLPIGIIGGAITLCFGYPFITGAVTGLPTGLLLSYLHENHRRSKDEMI